MPLPIPQYDPNAFSNAFQQARGNRLQDVYMQRDAEATQYNRQRQSAADQRVAVRDEQDLNDREREILAKVYAPLAQQAVQSGDVRGFYASALANPRVRAQFQRDGFDMDEQDLQDPDFEAQIAGLAQMGAQPKPVVKWEDVQGPRGSRLQRNPETGELRQVVGPDNSQPANPGRARTLSPEEVRANGFPEGSVVQELPDGRLDVVNKREGLSAAEQKTVREAKVRMPRLNAALRRVDRLGAAVAAIANNSMFNGGPMDSKVLKYSKDGQEVTAAAAQLMPELQALTRVPGIGSQSDLEARLASLALPSLEVDPQVNARSQAELRAFVEDLKAAYESLVNGSGEPQAGQPPRQATQTPEVTATNPQTGQKIALRNGQWVPL